MPPYPAHPCCAVNGGEDLPEQDPHRVGKSKAHGAQAAFAPRAVSGSVQAAIPLAFRSRARGTRGSDGHGPPGPFLPRCSHAGACPGLHPQALQPRRHGSLLRTRTGFILRWPAGCVGVCPAGALLMGTGQGSLGRGPWPSPCRDKHLSQPLLGATGSPVLSSSPLEGPPSLPPL